MTTIGEGVMRECCDCFITIGCYQPDEAGTKLDCEKCSGNVCPDTHQISHGLCDVCLSRALARKEAKKAV